MLGNEKEPHSLYREQQKGVEVSPRGLACLRATSSVWKCVAVTSRDLREDVPEEKRKGTEGLRALKELPSVRVARDVLRPKLWLLHTASPPVMSPGLRGQCSLWTVPRMKKSNLKGTYMTAGIWSCRNPFRDAYCRTGDSVTWATLDLRRQQGGNGSQEAVTRGSVCGAQQHSSETPWMDRAPGTQAAILQGAPAQQPRCIQPKRRESPGDTGHGSSLVMDEENTVAFTVQMYFKANCLIPSEESCNRKSFFPCSPTLTACNTFSKRKGSI